MPSVFEINIIIVVLVDFSYLIDNIDAINVSHFEEYEKSVLGKLCSQDILNFKLHICLNYYKNLANFFISQASLIRIYLDYFHCGNFH